MNQPPKTSILRVAFVLMLTVLGSGAFAVLKHFVSYGFDWYGGIPRLVHFAAAGAFLGTFPALAGIAVAIHRLQDHKSAIEGAAIGAGVIWIAQYAIILIATSSMPSFSDSSYAIVSILAAAAGAWLISPKDVASSTAYQPRPTGFAPRHSSRHHAGAHRS